MRKHETYEEEYEEYDLPTEPQDEPEDPQATIEQTVVHGHCISIEKFFDGFSVGDYVKSPSGPVDILAVRDCDGYPFPYTCATIDEARAIYAACIKAASEPWERKETEETQ